MPRFSPLALVALLVPAAAFPCTAIVGAHGHIGAGPGAWALGIEVRPRVRLGLALGLVHAPCCHDGVVAAPAEPAPPAPPPPPPPAAVVIAQPAPVERAARVPALALKWAPLGTSLISPTRVPETGLIGSARSFGLEYRWSEHLALRGDLEYGELGTVWDLPGLKVSLFPHSKLRPYLSGGLSARSMERDSQRSLHVGGVAAAGVDLYLGRRLFIEAEARYRVMPGNCCGELHQWTGLVGAGLALF